MPEHRTRLPTTSPWLKINASQYAIDALQEEYPFHLLDTGHVESISKEQGESHIDDVTEAEIQTSKLLRLPSTQENVDAERVQ